MKHRLTSALLVLTLLFFMIPSAHAAQERFTPSQSYTGQFADVSPDAWYYDNIKALYELGLAKGQGSTDHFVPDAPMTVAEALTLCARIRSLYDKGDSEAGADAFRADNAEHWYSHYVAYLQSLNIIQQEFEELYALPATRAQMAHILANTLPRELFQPINQQTVVVGYSSRKFIRDVTEYTPYQQDILLLYQWGILGGTDSAGSFRPDEALQRCQAAAMFTRLVRSDLRITLNWENRLTNSKQGTVLPDLIPTGAVFHAAPAATDTAAIDDNIRYMLSRGERRMVLSYPRQSLTEEGVNAIMSAFLNGIGLYPEQTYNHLQCSYSAATGSVVLTFSSSLYNDRMIDSYREAIMKAAVEIHDTLWNQGVITASMSEYDKALTYYTWLCDNCRYDDSADDQSMSHSAYNLFYNGLAVCDGYTAAYNLLLKLEGITCCAVSTPGHIWTRAVLDGQALHIDPTWGDQSGTVDYQYFAMTEDAAFARFA